MKRCIYRNNFFTFSPSPLQQLIPHLLSSLFRLITSSSKSVLVHNFVELCLFPHESVLTFKMFQMEEEVSDLSVFHTEQCFVLNFPSSGNTFLGLTQLAAFWLQLGKFTIIPLNMETRHFFILSPSDSECSVFHEASSNVPSLCPLMQLGFNSSIYFWLL